MARDRPSGGPGRPGNGDVVRALRELALFLEMDGVAFKPRAFERASYAVAALDRPVAEIEAQGGAAALEEIPGIGAGIAARIVELLHTGRIAELEALRRRTPVDLPGLTAVEGVGPRKARALWEALGVRDVEGLRRAAREGRIRTLPHFGERSERRLLQALEFHAEAAGRRPLGEVLEVAAGIEQALAAVPGVVEAVVAGSIRRRRDTIGDVDVLVAAADPEPVSRAFEGLPGVRSILASGPTKTMVRLANGMDADLRVLPPESFGAALLYFTGSKAHNVALRRLARAEGAKLSEYGLFRGERRVAGRTEREVYAALGMQWIPPELREDAGEVELARQGKLPRLLEPGDVRGDLQVHTRWTDGSSSIEAMARAAHELGREYLAITDHGPDLPVTGGLDAAALRRQVDEVRTIDRRLGGIRLLAGVEAGIRPDGSLDLDDGVLGELDLVGAAVHSHFDQPRAEMTRRLVRAVENPRVHVLFHPLARSLGRRRPVDVDFEALLAACVRTGTVLEIDAQPDRLDLPDDLVRAAIHAGARVAVDSDAHAPAQLRFVELYGVGVARRGWAGKGQVVNALPLAGLLASLKHAEGTCRSPSRSPTTRSRRAPS